MVKNSSEEIKQIVKGDEDAFIFGTMGPDYLFAVRELGFKEKKLANLMHSLKQYELFDVTSKYLRENYDKTLMSYMLGFLTHYISDYHVHSFVNYFCENELLQHMPHEYAKYTHNIIELAGDEYVLNTFMGYPNSNDYKLHKVLAVRCTTSKKVGKLFENVIAKIYGSPFSAFNGWFSLLATRATFWATRDKSGKKMKLVRKMEKAFGLDKQIAALMRPAPGYGEIDYLNFAHKPWRAVRNREEMVDLDYIELLDVAVKAAAEIYFPMYLAAVKDGTPLDEQYFRISFDGIDYAYVYESKNGLKSPATVIYERVEKPVLVEDETEDNDDQIEESNSAEEEAEENVSEGIEGSALEETEDSDVQTEKPAQAEEEVLEETDEPTPAEETEENNSEELEISIDDEIAVMVEQVTIVPETEAQKEEMFAGDDAENSEKAVDLTEPIIEDTEVQDTEILSDEKGGGTAKESNLTESQDTDKDSKE
jgi:hypothetical protein